DRGRRPAHPDPRRRAARIGRVSPAAVPRLRGRDPEPERVHWRGGRPGYLGGHTRDPPLPARVVVVRHPRGRLPLRPGAGGCTVYLAAAGFGSVNRAVPDTYASTPPRSTIEAGPTAWRAGDVEGSSI